ncbi:MAG: OmpP1/FadL family transporter [Bacteroidales bacterium]
MKKIISVVSALVVTGSLFAGGLVTNTNQSALYTRLQSRNASTSIDAVYYNPAGLTKLSDGFHFSLNNQTIGQTQKIKTAYNYLNGSPKEYVGKVSAPIYPGVYAAYKTGKLALSLGFNPVGGGGGATYDTGLPSFEMQVANLVPMLANQLTPLDQAIFSLTGTDPNFNGITGYNSNIYFKGSSIYFGLQANASYEINEMLSVAIGGRYVMANNKYEGYIQDVTITAPAAYGGAQTPGAYLRLIAAVPGVPAPTAAQLNGTAAYLDDATTVEADAVMKGNGITPILSVNFAPVGDLINIGLKYEFKTKMTLTTTVNDSKDAEGMFIQDSTAIADMPAMLALGIDVKPSERLLITGSFNYYFDKGVDYDGQEDVELNKIDKNFIEAALGLQVGLTDNLCLSAGWLTTVTGVNDNYQSDLKYSLNTNTFGGGLGIKVNDMLDINLGGSYTIYQEGSKSYTGAVGPATDIYNKNTWVAAIGLDFHF